MRISQGGVQYTEDRGMGSVELKPGGADIEVGTPLPCVYA